MGFLTPLFLAAAAAVAVPVLLHLLHLRSGKRRPFPALRYLRRTEREHARRIRLRQILLLLLRAAAILLLVAAGARLFLGGQQGDHEPTALAIVVDNTASSGVIAGDERVLDRLKRRALESVDAATPEDRIWVIRAGEPGETPLPMDPAGARARIEETEPVGGSTSLDRVVREARSLVAAAGMPAAEVHLLSDLQATALSGGGSPAEAEGDGVPLLVLDDEGEAPVNRYIASVLVGGGLPPVVDEPTEVAVEVDISGPGGGPTSTEAGSAGGEEDDAPSGEEGDGGGISGDSVRVRVRIGERLVSAADAPLGSTVLVPMGPFPLEEVTGSVEIDPDRLRADDRRWFAFRVRDPAGVGVEGDPGVFLEEALGVLEEGRRVRVVPSGSAQVLVSTGGEGLAALPEDVPVVLVPSSDPALLPAMNRRLREAGIPWSLSRMDSATATGEEGLVAAEDLPVGVSGIRVQSLHALTLSDGGPASRTVVRTERGSPWLVAGTSTEGRSYLLLASPMNPDATSLPVSPEMLPVVEWMVSGWPPTFRTESSVEAGTPLLLPAGATRIRTPAGTVYPVDGRQPFQETYASGIYTIFAGDSVVSRRAVNIPESESRLARLAPDEAGAILSPPIHWVSGPDGWSREIFRQRRGREPWRLLLLAVLLVLVGEGLAAAGGGRSSARSTSSEDAPPRATRTGAASV